MDDPFLDPTPEQQELLVEKAKINFDWDWQRFLLGFSFERSKYICVNLGFLAIIYAKSKWTPWMFYK